MHSRIHAWDTEVIDIDAKEESPVGKGKIICAQAFCGPEVDFGNGPSSFIIFSHPNIMKGCLLIILAQVMT